MKSCMNRFHDAIYILGDVVVPEPQHAISLFLQPTAARFVVYLLAIFGVLRAVDFDQKPCRHAGKVGNVGTDRHLPAKMRTIEFKPSKMTPQFLFGIGRVATKLMGAQVSDVSNIFAAHALPHPPPAAATLPLSGEGFMAAIAQRLVRGTLAGAEPDFFVGGCLPFLRAEFAAFVRAVAERLRLRAPAGAPPVAFAGCDVDRDRPPAADFRYSAHVFFPPPSVASHASPHALASSRTRKM